MTRYFSFSSTWVCLIVMATCVSLPGCGGGEQPGRGVPVSGTVTLGGQPLEGASVTFMNDTFAGYGRTDSEGRYRLVQGALPGQNKVVISKIDGEVEAKLPDGDPAAALDPGQLEAAAMGTGQKIPEGPKDLVPADYSDPNNTRLTYDVPADGAEAVDFNL